MFADRYSFSNSRALGIAPPTFSSQTMRALIGQVSEAHAGQAFLHYHQFAELKSNLQALKSF